MKLAIPVALTAVLLALGALHVFWAVGVSTPGLSVIPESHGKALFTPSRTATVLVALALFTAAFVASSRGQLWFPAKSGSLTHWAAIGAGCVFLLRAVGEFKYIGFFKSHQGTQFATMDTWVYSPLCLLIAAGFFLEASRP
jgi:hypothetical protein